MTIRRLLWSSLLMLGVVAIGLSASIAYRQLGIMTRAHIAVLRVDILLALANVTAVVNTERGLATVALRLPPAMET